MAKRLMQLLGYLFTKKIGLPWVKLTTPSYGEAIARAG
jgi:hypothetical protein